MIIFHYSKELSPSFHNLSEDTTKVAKLDFGQPGVNEQDGFTKLGLPDGGSGTYTGTFPCQGKTCTIKVSGYTHTRGNYAAVVNKFAPLSNLLRSSFLRNSLGTITVEISGLKPSTTYEMKTYHHSTSYPRGGVDFTLQYDGNPINKLKQSANGNNPSPPLIHTEVVRSDSEGKISFVMKGVSGGGAHMDLNGMELRTAGNRNVLIDIKVIIPKSVIEIAAFQNQHMPSIR